jgi:hypothetical protein
MDLVFVNVGAELSNDPNVKTEGLQIINRQGFENVIVVDIVVEECVQYPLALVGGNAYEVQVIGQVIWSTAMD